jgi:adenine-specific DNA-methyltransferase
VPIHAPGIRNGETGKPWRGKMPPPGKHWQYPPSVLEEMDKRGEIYWSPNLNPRRKVYFEASSGIPVQDIWLDYKDAHNQNVHVTGYPTEKNLAMLKLMIKSSSNEGDLVLDCFAGSGTTLVAANSLKRNWVGIDDSFQAIKTMLERFRVGSRPMGDYVAKLDSPAMNDQTELSLFSSRNKESGDFQQDDGKELIEDYSLFVTDEHLEQAADLLTRNPTYA